MKRNFMSSSHCANKEQLGQRSSRLVHIAFSKRANLEAEEKIVTQLNEETIQEIPVVMVRGLETI